MRIRNVRPDESLPQELRDTGTPYIDPDWAWVACGADDVPFAIIVASFAHGWLVLWRVIAVPSASPNWFLEAFPQVFDNAKKRGCLGVLTMLADRNPQEVKMAKIVAKMPHGTLLPFNGSIGVFGLE